MIKKQYLDALEKILNVTFSDDGYIQAALTHKSANKDVLKNFERLEFLGDRVLGLVISQELLSRFPKASEGVLSKKFNALVRRETLADIATKIDIGKYIILGKSEELSNARERPALLADVMEALIAVIYLQGGIDAVRQFILKYWHVYFQDSSLHLKDAKSQLQEWALAHKYDLPKYEITDKSGADHAPKFTVMAKIDGVINVQAVGHSRKAAETTAATKILNLIESGHIE